jgi:hypothetical protein
MYNQGGGGAASDKAGAAPAGAAKPAGPAAPPALPKPMGPTAPVIPGPAKIPAPKP